MEQKTIFITGASRGIGKSIALLFASRGYHTFLNCSSSVDELKKLRAYITEKYHTPCTLVPGNVGNPDHVRAIYNKIYQECTHLDVLVNNAGISYINLLTDMTDEDWNRIIQTNLSSVFYCCRQAIPPMVSKRSGKIINISSVSGILGNAGQANYCASKAGVIGLTKSVARELSSRGITCNAVAPGGVLTKAMADMHFPEETMDPIPLRRLSKPEDIANAVVFLASEKAAMITGQTLVIDGGSSIVGY